MNLVGLMPARNEDWILGLSARVALLWCDRLVILNHASTDNTESIVRKLQSECGEDRVQLMADSEPTWNEMDHRQRMLGWARANATETGATHVAIIDADEILTGNLIDGVRDQVARLDRRTMLCLPGYNLRGGLNRYHLNGVWGQRWFSTAFRDSNEAHWKGDTFHHREPLGVAWLRYKPVNQGAGGVLHLWGANERRLVAKHALYKCTEALRWPGKPKKLIDTEYSLAIRGRPWIGDASASWTFTNVPEAWWKPYASLMNHLRLDAVPWQEEEVRRLVAEHGRERFVGLDLFGVD